MRKCSHHELFSINGHSIRNVYLLNNIDVIPKSLDELDFGQYSVIHTRNNYTFIIGRHSDKDNPSFTLRLLYRDVICYELKYSDRYDAKIQMLQSIDKLSLCFAKPPNTGFET